MRWLQTSAAAGASVLLALAGPSLAEAPDAGTPPAKPKPYPSCPDVAPPKLPMPKWSRSYPPGCGRGSGDCQYVMGFGRPKYEARNQWKQDEQACEAGEVRRCARMGTAIAKSTNGHKPSPEELERLQRSLQLFKKACDGGDSIGCVNLAYMHEEGYATPKDPDQAVRLYQRACELKDVAGCVELAALCGFGPRPMRWGGVGRVL